MTILASLRKRGMRWFRVSAVCSNCWGMVPGSPGRVMALPPRARTRVSVMDGPLRRESRVPLAGTRIKEEIQNRLSVREMLDRVVQSRRDKVLPHEDGMSLVVVDNQDYGRAVHGWAPAVWSTAGNETRKVDPDPSRLSTQIFPFWRSRTRWAIVRPSPSPADASGFSR